jgi:hypothetical protein
VKITAVPPVTVSGVHHLYHFVDDVGIVVNALITAIVAVEWYAEKGGKQAQRD